MKILKRTINLSKLLQVKSHFLFGPRAVGKTTLYEHQLPEARVIDLLDAENYRRFLKSPKTLEGFAKEGRIVVIDEIQKLPELLDEVHRLIHRYGTRFLLTGSSARKIRRGGANLLGARAWWAELFPLTSHEIENFNLSTYLNTGGLPEIYGQNHYVDYLNAYTSLYLKEEIQEEALTRNILLFSEFLDLMAISCGEELNFQNLSSDCGVSVHTIKNYLQILQDTLVGFELLAFTKTKKRKAISRSKFYYFDLGVTNSLAQRGEIKIKSELYGKAFEHFIVLEVRAFLSYHKKKHVLSYWRSTTLFEVDLILYPDWAFEIKASDDIYSRHLKGLRAFQEEGIVKNFGVICLEPMPREIEGIKIFPWEYFLQKLWSGDLL